MSTLEARYAEVVQRISAAADSAGRSSDEICLIVVSKNHPAQLVLDLLALGARDFGENRDQEAAPKASEVATANKQANWHFIGQLQTNKAKSVLDYARSVHSLDRPSLLAALAKSAAGRELGPLEVFIQLNLTDDPGRGGIEPAQLLSFAEQVLSADALVLKGVMGVAALDRDPRVDFETIRRASEQLQTLAPEASSISAGMSHDFEAAIGLGATHLRIGTAITGNRNY